MLEFKLRRSRGVRVTLRVHHLLQRGNRARAREDWAAAAGAYTQALQIDPSLAHIWVQLGHALKEQDRTDEAQAAYRRASDVAPGDPDPHLHLGHLASMRGDRSDAARHYAAAFRADPADADAAGALHRAIVSARGRTRAELIEMIRTTLGDQAAAIDAGVQDRQPGTAETLVFDASDLVGYYAHARLPTGIQRVQIQAITHALAASPDVRVCCFIEGRGDWLEIPSAMFQTLVALSLQHGDRADPAWIMALHRLHLRLNSAAPFLFPVGATLVNLGSSWQLHNYFLFVREAKRTRSIRYVPFVHDLIPIVAPEHFTNGAKREVVPWVIGIFEHADHFLANSEATKRDLLRTAATLGHTVAPDNVAVIRLDADFRPKGGSDAPAGSLARWGLHDTPFVLLVSTVESRKGHLTAFAAWRTLIDRHGPGRVPILVCVGKRGWLSDSIYTRLDSDPALASRVRMLSGVADADLALLYRHCSFTLYPSLYEGWGLPITEALSYGKAVIASDTSSLPEAGGAFALYVPPGDPAALAAAAETLAFDDAKRAAWEARIAAGFRARTWTEIAAQIRTDLLRLGAARGGVQPGGQPGAIRPPPQRLAVLGDYHALARGTAIRLWPGASTSETFRVGTGWRAPDTDATWTGPHGGELSIALPPHDGSLRLGLLLVGPRDREVVWTLSVRQGPRASGLLAPHRRKWITQTLPASLTRTGPLRLRLRAEPAEPDPTHPDGDEATIGLAGFFLYPENDHAAERRLLEAIAFGTLDDLDADRPPPPLPGPLDEWDG